MRNLLMTMLILLALGGAFETAAETEPWIPTIHAPQFFAVLVDDVDACAEWYVLVFGLAVESDQHADDDIWRIVSLVGEHMEIELIRDDKGRTNKGERPPRHEFYGIAKIGFYVDDLEALADRVRAASGERPRILSFGKRKLIQIHDPEGNTLQIYAWAEE